MTSLLDVNVLIAIAWPNHVHHAVAREWFADHADEGWATCGVTESGFVRVSSNPALPHAVMPGEAIDLLGRLRLVGAHSFLADEVSFVASPHLDRARIGSYRQVTDAHLVAVARSHHGCLVTLDRGVSALARSLGDTTIVHIGTA